MNEPGTRERRIRQMAVVASLCALALWYGCIFRPERQAMQTALADASSSAQQVEAIETTLRKAGAIRRARADVLARLAGERRGTRQAVESILLMLDRNARRGSISIVEIAPGPQRPDLQITLEGRFDNAMRFIAAASASGVPLDIRDVRLNAERRQGHTQLLLAQIDVRPFEFAIPK